jgi:hypothetical protein
MKFYEDDRLALFDLSKDLSEQNDLSKQMPAETEQLHERLKKYLADVDAQFATPNPDYDPSNPPSPRKGGKGGMKKGGSDKPKGGNKGQKPKDDA